MHLGTSPQVSAHKNEHILSCAWFFTLWADKQAFIRKSTQLTSIYILAWYSSRPRHHKQHANISESAIIVTPVPLNIICGIHLYVSV